MSCAFGWSASTSRSTSGISVSSIAAQRLALQPCRRRRAMDRRAAATRRRSRWTSRAGARRSPRGNVRRRASEMYGKVFVSSEPTTWLPHGAAARGGAPVRPGSGPLGSAACGGGANGGGPAVNAEVVVRGFRSSVRSRSSLRYLAQSIPSFRIRARKVCGLIFSSGGGASPAFNTAMRDGQHVFDMLLHRRIERQDLGRSRRSLRRAARLAEQPLAARWLPGPGPRPNACRCPRSPLDR